MRSICLVVVAWLLAGPAHAQFLGKSALEWSRELKSGEAAGRRSAAFALGKIGSASAAADLKEAVVGDPSPKVRDAAAYALGEIALRNLKVGRDRELIDVLTRALRDDDPLVRRSAAYALGCLGGDAAAARPAVEKVLGDNRPEVRQSAAWALGRLGDQAVPALCRVLTDSDPFVLRDAVNSLGQLDPEPVHDAVGDLAKLANHRDVEVRRSALLVLVRVVVPGDGKSSAVAAGLQKALLDGDLENRRNAAFALSNIGGSPAAPAVDVLLEALAKGDLELKRQAAAAFRNIGAAGSKAVPELIDCLKDQDTELRTNAALALGGIGKNAERAVPALVDVVADTREKAEVRDRAAVALSLIGAVPAAVDAVPKLLSVAANPADDDRVRERTMWALRVHNIKLADMPAVRTSFLKILAEPPRANNRLIRHDCAYLSAMIYGPKAPPEVFPVLLSYLKDDTFKVYRKTASLVGGTASETTSGKTSTQELGDGDYRTAVMEALDIVGPDVIRRYPDIVAQIRVLADSEGVDPGLRKMCRSYLQKVR